MRKPNGQCQQCKKPFYARPSAKAKGEGKYCSWACYAKKYGRTTCYPINKQCEFCKKTFIITTSRHRKKRFCSSVCAAKTHNPRRKGTKYNAEYTLRDKLIEMFGHKCSICEYKTAVDAHHIITKAKGGNNTIENGILLCPNHHREVHMKLISIEYLIHIRSSLKPVTNVIK